MIRWKLKGCPRCSDDLNIIRDDLGYYEDCLQCGYHHYYNDKKSGIEQYESRDTKKELEFSSFLTNIWSGEEITEN
jgi:Zn ribbon nucleic-acid-binding protein